jgi:hypothetical protein
VIVTRGVVRAQRSQQRAPWRMTAALLLRVPGRKPGVSTRTTSGSAVAVAELDEPGALLRPTRRPGSRRGVGLVGDHADRRAVDAGEADDEVARPARAELEQRAASTSRAITSRTS